MSSIFKGSIRDDTCLNAKSKLLWDCDFFQIFLDKCDSDSESSEKIIFSATRPDGFSVKAYLVDPCKNLICTNNEDQQSDLEGVIDYLFREARINVRKAKLNLASSEQSYDNICKLISNFLIFLRFSKFANKIFFLITSHNYSRQWKKFLGIIDWHSFR